MKKISSCGKICDENCNILMVYQVNENGEVVYDYLSKFSWSSMIYIVNEETGELVSLLKIYIKEDGRIYGLYSDGTEKLLAQIALSTSNTSLELVRENPKIEISKP